MRVTHEIESVPQCVCECATSVSVCVRGVFSLELPRILGVGSLGSLNARIRRLCPPRVGGNACNLFSAAPAAAAAGACVCARSNNEHLMQVRGGHFGGVARLVLGDFSQESRRP